MGDSNPQEQRKDTGASEKDHRLGCLFLPRLVLPRQGHAFSSNSQGPPPLFQGALPPLCTPSPGLTRLSTQDPFVEPIFT